MPTPRSRAAPASSSTPCRRSLSFEEAASLPLVGLTAYQSLVHHALKPGQRVLVNGCSGGVGLIAVQLAKALGATVVGVCSAVNQDAARQAGCDEVIDYRARNLLAEDLTVDVWFDVVGHHSLRAVRHQMARRCLPQHRQAGQHEREQLVQPDAPPNEPRGLRHAERGRPRKLRTLIDQGALNPVIEEVYPLDRIGAAFERSRSQRTVGKLVISMVD